MVERTGIAHAAAAADRGLPLAGTCAKTCKPAA